MVGLERRFAVAYRTSYEKLDGSFARKTIPRMVSANGRILRLKMLVKSLQFAVLIAFMIAKNMFIFHTSQFTNINERLLEAFLFECTPKMAAATNFCAGATWLFGILVCLNSDFMAKLLIMFSNL